MTIVRTADTDDDGTGTTGTIHNNAWKTALYDAIDALVTEGTWTPVLGGAGGTSGQTYSTQIGRYAKAGKLTLAYFDVVFTAKGTITGNAQISGLPFAADSGGVVVQSGTVAFASLNTTWVQVQTLMLASASVALLQGMTVAAVSNNTSLTTTDLTNTTSMRGTILYRASS